MSLILFNDYALLEEDIYFFDGIYGIPGKVNVNSGQITIIESDEKTTFFSKQTMDYMTCKNKKLYCLQSDGVAIKIYDLVKEKCKSIAVDCSHIRWNNFSEICEIGDSLYIFPRYFKKIIEINTKEDVVRPIVFEYNEKQICWTCSCKIEDNIYIFPHTGNAVLVFNIGTKKCNIIYFEDTFLEVVSCVADGETIYLLNKNGSIYLINIKYRSIKEVSIMMNGKASSETYNRILLTDKSIVLLPSLADDIKILDKEFNNIERYNEVPVDLNYCKDIIRAKYYGCCEDDDYYYLLGVSNYLLKIHKKSGEFVWIRLQIPPVGEWLKKLEENGITEFGEKKYTLEAFVNNISKTNSKEIVEKNLVGSNIWKKIK